MLIQGDYKIVSGLNHVIGQILKNNYKIEVILIVQWYLYSDMAYEGFISKSKSKNFVSRDQC